jgi:ribosomal protein S12 methylthiotransferase
VGFPGEKASDFEELLQFVKEEKFERLGAFAYSREENTPAYSFSGQVPKKTKTARLDRIMEAQYNIHAEKNSNLVGKTLKVVCEGYDEVAEIYYGRSEMDAPEIDSKIYFSARHRVRDGEFLSVEITEASDYDLIGKEKI